MFHFNPIEVRNTLFSVAECVDTVVKAEKSGLFGYYQKLEYMFETPFGGEMTNIARVILDGYVFYVGRDNRGMWNVHHSGMTAISQKLEDAVKLLEA